MSIPPPVTAWINMIAPSGSTQHTFSAEINDHDFLCNIILHNIQRHPDRELNFGQLIDSVKCLQACQLALANAAGLSTPLKKPAN